MDTSDRQRRASEEAAAWLVRLSAEPPQSGEPEEFVEWLRESPLHVAEMSRIAKVNNALEQFQGWGEVNTDGADEDDENIVVPLPLPPEAPCAPGSSRVPRRRRWTGLITATIACLVLFAGWFLTEPGTHTIETERGERREVALADGSVVDVDPETRLRIAFEKHTRRVFLDKGRALFKVAKNPARPFLVQADGTTVRAVGTAFGVEHRNDGVIVTVAEGKVGVSVKEFVKESPVTSSDAGSPTPGAPRGAAHTELLLTAGQQVRTAMSGTAEPVREVDSDRELAWAKGKLVFDNETVADAIEEFNRYNRLQLRVADGPLARRRVSAVFNATDPESFIAFLQAEASVRVMRRESTIMLQ